MRSIIIAALMLALGCGAEAAESISKYEVRRAPAARVEREVLGQLAEIIRPSRAEHPPLTDQRPIMPLSDMWFETEPRNTEAPGLCRYDELIMEFEPTGEPGTGADTRVKASGFTARSQFAVIAPPKGLYEGIVWGETPPPKGPSCAHVDKNQFFFAPDGETAFNGIYRINQVFAAVAEPVLPFTLDCEWKDTPEGCREALAKLSATRPEEWGGLSDVDRCDTPDGVYGECFRVTFDDRAARLIIVNGELNRVTLNQFIVLATARRD